MTERKKRAPGGGSKPYYGERMVSAQVMLPVDVYKLADANATKSDKPLGELLRELVIEAQAARAKLDKP